MAVEIAEIKRLRELTGVGMTDAKKALEAAEGDFDKALTEMRKKGMTKAEKSAAREARAGVVSSYVHDNRIGVLLEVNCETDFVARSDKFRELAHELALQIAASAPRYLKADLIPAEVLEHEAEIARTRAKEEGKPDNVVEKIVQGRLEKFKDEVVLSRQAYIRDESITVEKLILQTVAALGENVIVRRFQRWELGESLNN